MVLVRLRRVCLVIDLECFFVSPTRGRPGQFFVREMGWSNWQGRFTGSYHYGHLTSYRDLSLRDRRTVDYIMFFHPPPKQDARPIQ